MRFYPLLPRFLLDATPVQLTAGPLSFLALHFVDLKAMQLSPLLNSRGRVAAELSLNGKYVVAVPSDGNSLWLFEVASQRWSQIAEGSFGDFKRSADSSSIYLDAGSDTEPVIRCIRLSDRQLVSVPAKCLVGVLLRNPALEK